MSLFGSEHWMYSSGGASFYDTQIDGSLRFNRPDSAYLTRTPASDGTRTKWTWSAWVKLAVLPSSSSNDMMLFNSGSGSAETTCYINGINGRIEFYHYSGGFSFILKTNNFLRDPSAWYHIVIRYDSTDATSSNRQRIYINGEQVTSFDTANYSSQNFNTFINSNTQHWIATWQNTSSMFSGYMADVYFTDGQSLAPTSFGETKSGVWIPKAYSGSYGTNGYHLEFAGNANDSSGNGNNWTANNLSSYDYVPDSPTNNFITFGSIQNPTNSWSASQGNLRLQSGTNDLGCAGNGYFGGNGGKWYFEWINAQNNNTTYMTAGICDNTAGNSTDKSDDSLAGGLAWGSGELYYLSKQGYVGTRTTQITSSGPTWTTVGDVIMVALDLDNGKLWFGSNGTWYNSGNPASGTNATFTGVEDKPYTTFVHAFQSGHAATFNFGQDSSFAGVKTAQGNSDGNGYGDFYYAPPSGYLALCTENFTVAEAVDPALDASPQDYFNTLLYTGNGATNRNITGVGFQPDFLWIKNRSAGGNNHHLFNAVIGMPNHVSSDLHYQEATATNKATAFLSDGFTIQNHSSVNASGNTYVAWNWKANGTGSSNTVGSISSTVSANTDAGISIVSYTGSTGVQTVGHGLNSAPEIILVKNRSSDENWRVYSQAAGGGTGALKLNATDSFLTLSAFWNNTDTTSTVFTVNSAAPEVNENGSNHIAYCFHSVEGFSKFGSYTGNGSSDGPFVYTGFRPAFVLVKVYTTSTNWFIVDNERANPFNVVQAGLYPDTADAESTYAGGRFDLLSNGFKVRGDPNWDVTNSSGQGYIYMAFAENPFKYANAR